MENTFNKLFDLEECPVRVLQDAIFDFILTDLYPGYENTYVILNEELSVWCLDPNIPIEFNEDGDDVFMELEIKLGTENWELSATANWRLIQCRKYGFDYDRCWPTKFIMHGLKGDLKDLKSTFIAAKMTGIINEYC